MVRSCTLPAEALLQRYRESGAYTDCYAVDVPWPVSQAEYVEAFYTTWVFTLERVLLAWLVARPSTDAQAAALASGSRGEFAAWRVEGRSDDQLLMCDFRGRTRSWLMSAAVGEGGIAATRLRFGSAVVPAADARSGRRSMGWAFRALLGFHRVYSRVLLRAAASRLRRRRTG